MHNRHRSLPAFTVLLDARLSRPERFRAVGRAPKKRASRDASHVSNGRAAGADLPIICKCSVVNALQTAEAD